VRRPNLVQTGNIVGVDRGARVSMMFTETHAHASERVCRVGMLASAMLCAAHFRLTRRWDWALGEERSVERAGLQRTGVLMSGDHSLRDLPTSVWTCPGFADCRGVGPPHFCGGRSRPFPVPGRRRDQRLRCTKRDYRGRARRCYSPCAGRARDTWASVEGVGDSCRTHGSPPK